MQSVLVIEPMGEDVVTGMAKRSRNVLLYGNETPKNRRLLTVHDRVMDHEKYPTMNR
jgi:hypothetical protein